MARIAKAVKDAKTGRKAAQKVASQVNKATDELKKQLQKLDKRKKDPGGSQPASRTIKYKANDGQKKIKPVQSRNRNSQATEQKGVLKGVGGTVVAGGVVGGVNKAISNKKTAPKTTPKKLPLAKKGVTINMKGTGKGIRYYQNGKEVRIK